MGQRSSGVGHTSAPSSRSRVSFSAGAAEGMVMVHPIPRRLHRAARAMPVLPEVGSTSCLPPSRPSRSSPSSRHRAVRSLIEPKGFIHSSFGEDSPRPSLPAVVQADQRGGIRPRADELRDVVEDSLSTGSSWLSPVSWFDGGTERRGGRGRPHEEDGRGADTADAVRFPEGRRWSPRSKRCPGERPVLDEREGVSPGSRLRERARAATVRQVLDPHVDRQCSARGRRFQRAGSAFHRRRAPAGT